MTDTLVAHVRELGTGEMHLWVGERQVEFNDPALARALFRATRSYLPTTGRPAGKHRW